MKIFPEISPSVSSFAVAPNSVYVEPSFISCGFATVRVIVGSVVSNLLKK